MAIAATLFVAIVMLVAVASVARTMGSPIIWSIEVAQLMFVWLVMLAADIALQQKRHFGLSLLLDHLPPRVRLAFDVLNILILVALLGYLLQFAFKNVSLMQLRLTGALQLPSSYVHGALAAGLILFLRTLLVQLYWRLTGKEQI